MRSIYTTYEAKAKFSEILRRVRRGQTVLISYHGRQVAEIRPAQPAADAEQAVRELERDGLLSQPHGTPGQLQPIASRPGGLARFLGERD